MKERSKWFAGCGVCVCLIGMVVAGCSPPPEAIFDADYVDPSETIAQTVADIQNGIETILYSNGTYTIGPIGSVWQTGTWRTSGNTITFTPSGDDPFTASYSRAANGTMTVSYDGETHVFRPI